MTIPQRPWYRQPLVWMLVLIPFTSVVMGIAMLYLAITSFDGMVVDDYYKHGKEINLVLERDHRALALGLSGELVLDAEQGRVNLALRANRGTALPERARLRFLHATRAGFDQQLAMVRTAGGRYHGVLPKLAPGSWYLLLEADDWRLSGHYDPATTRRIVLRPANQ